MDEKNWRVENLEKTQAQHQKDIDDLKQFKYSSIEKFKTIFKRLSDLEKSSKWVSQSFFYLIFGGAISAVFALIQWLITR